MRTATVRGLQSHASLASWESRSRVAGSGRLPRRINIPAVLYPAAGDVVDSTMRKAKNDVTPDLVSSMTDPDSKDPVDFEMLMLRRSYR